MGPGYIRLPAGSSSPGGGEMKSDETETNIKSSLGSLSLIPPSILRI